MRLSIYPAGIFYCVGCLIFKVRASDNPLARGFGDHIPWYTLDEGIAQARAYNMPVMVVIHKTWCGACRSLKPKFAESLEIAELSKHFIMVNLEDDEEPKGKAFSPDGGYIPRILFLNSDGEVQTEYINENGNSQYKYFYPDAESIVAMMKKVLDVSSTDSRFDDEL